MPSWPSPSTLQAVEQSRRATLLYRLLTAMGLLALVTLASSLLEERNDLRVTFAFYGVVLVWLVVVGAIVRSGRVALAGWSLGLFFWGLIALVTLFFGGLQGQNASTFAVAVLLLGGTVGGRAALAMAAASSMWCALVAYWEIHQLLPAPLGPYSPLNAWGAFTATVLLTSVLLHESLRSLKFVHAQAEQWARERDEALRRSIQSQKMELVGNLASGVAHDFNNLLSVIGGSSDIIRSSVDAHDDEQSAVLDDLDDATNRAALLTRQLLSFGRTRVGEPEAVDLSAVVSSMAKMLPTLLGVRVKVVVSAPEACWVNATRVGMEQILLNLAVNARDAMPDGGHFTASVELLGDEVCLRACDTGIGISPEAQRFIFEPFFTTKAMGTGLGLATVKHQVEQFAGKIEVMSASGIGTQFVTRFPRIHGASDSAQVTRDTSQNTSRSKGRIVVVEDEPVLRRITARMLNRGGYEVVALAEAKEALALLSETSNIMCVVTDISMPGLDGEQFAARLAELFPRLPVIMVSGNREPSLDLAAKPLHRHLSKPVSSTELLDLINQLTAPGD